MNVLVVDVGGTSVKILATGQKEPRRLPSGPTMTPRQMVAGVKKLAGDWKYNAVSIGYPGQVVGDRVVTEPRNLAHGWVGFDFAAAFGCPVKVINDAAMQALGSYNGGTMLFLGLGTGLGSALMVRGHIVPMELGALSYGKGTIEDYMGIRGLQKLGKKKWRMIVERLVARFVSALLLDDVVIGGGNARNLEELPPGCRLGDNAYAFVGGFRLWEPATGRKPHTPQRPRRDQAKKTKGAHT
ncbi:MAG: ROK family protein [Thermodesulfobacteriota bacterium]|jgi:predicted NBD/HSP70 family sugar kinase